jgi:hypothetical protein
MTHVFYHQIDRIVKINKLYRFETELAELLAIGAKNSIERVDQLKKIVIILHNQKDKKQLSDEKMQAHFELINNSQYQKRWQFLNMNQRLNRLQEFIKRTDITDVDYIVGLTKGVTDGNLKTKDIKYNVVRGVIEDIDKDMVLNIMNAYTVKNDVKNDIKHTIKQTPIEKSIIKSNKKVLASVSKKTTNDDTGKVKSLVKTDTVSIKKTKSVKPKK